MDKFARRAEKGGAQTASAKDGATAGGAPRRGGALEGESDAAPVADERHDTGLHAGEKEGRTSTP